MKRTRGTISDPAQIEVLASGVRQDIMDTLLAAQDMTVRELGFELGVKRRALYYHLTGLERVGLIQRSEVARTDGRTESRYSVAEDSLEIEYRPGNPDNVEAVKRVVGSITRLADRDFGRGFDHAEVRVTGKCRNLWGARGKAWLSGADMERANELLDELSELFSKPPAQDGTLCALTWVLTPITPAEERVTPAEERAR